MPRCFPLSLLPALCSTLPLLAQHPRVPPTDAHTPPDATVRPAKSSLAARPATPTVALTQVLLDRPAADGPLWAIGSSWKANFDANGCEFVPFFGANAPRNFPVRVELATVTVGGEPLVLTAAEPRQVGLAVHTDRGAVREVLDLALHQVEQSFVFATLPQRGAIEVAVRLTSELTVAPTGRGLRLGNEFGAVTYEKAVALDARGARLDLPIRWVAGEARIAVPAAFVERAELPLVLDPVLTAVTVSTLAADDSPDVAVLQTPHVSCVVWRRQFSASDHDVWMQTYDSDGATLSPLQSIDFSFLDWIRPTIASNRSASNFLVVSEVVSGTLHYVAGRFVNSSGFAPTGQFDIDRSGVMGAAGNSSAADVGGDFFNGFSYYAVVFEKAVGADTDIVMKLVTPAGVVTPASGIAVDSTSEHASRPSISKCNGDDAVAPSRWLVVYQRTYPVAPNDQEVFGRYVSWSGVLVGPSFGIANSVLEEFDPSVGSPIDVGGTRRWPVVFTQFAPLPTQPSLYSDRTYCRVYDEAGTFQAGLDLGITHWPHCDSDGTRFLVTAQLPFPGVAVVSTIAFVPGTPNPLRVDQVEWLPNTTLEPPRVCADHSGGGQASSTYSIVTGGSGAVPMRLYRYGGWQTGTQFSVFPSACGSLSITASGNTAIGSTVTITVQHGGLSGTIFGYPGLASLQPVLGCNCVLGVSGGILMGNPLVWAVPPSPQLVGATLSVQGWSVVGSSCLGTIDLSDTIDFTIR